MIVTVLIGVFVPADWLYNPSPVSHPLQIDGTEVIHELNLTAASLCQCISDTTEFSINIYFIADINLITMDPVSSGTPVNFSIYIHDIGFYIPSTKTREPPNTLLSAYAICCSYLTNSVFADNDSYAVLPLVRIASTLYGQPAWNYTASGRIKFSTSGMTYLRLDVQQHPKYLEANVNQSNPLAPTLTPVMDIQPASNIVSSTQTTLRWEFVLIGGFGWLVIPSAVEAIVTKQRGKSQSTNHHTGTKNDQKQSRPPQRVTSDTTHGSKQKKKPATKN
jgi:hypothetical protein